MRSKPSEITHGRRGERGAALVMSLLMAMLLLAAGGALIATAGMTAANAADATAEVQAYYAADAGLQAALTVVRRNRAGSGGLAANFHNFACGTASACTNDGNNLSQWLTYGSGGRVTLSATPPLTYEVTVSDPGQSPTANLAADYTPRYLLIRSVGRGPQGAVKVMEMMVNRLLFEFDPKSTLLMAGNVTNFAIGNSRAKGYSGTDEANPTATPLPTFGFTQSGSQSSVDADVFNCSHNHCTKARGSTGDPRTSTITNSDLPPWLQTPQAADLFLDGLQAQAGGAGRYFDTRGSNDPSFDIGTRADPKFTFVDGDLSVSGEGGGLLVVTGNLTFSGGFDFDGIVLVLGSYKNDDDELVGGSIGRNGGGNGTIAGAMVVAKFDRDDPDAFLDTSFNTNGGGNSDIVYDSVKVANALGVLGSRMLGMVEK